MLKLVALFGSIEILEQYIDYMIGLFPLNDICVTRCPVLLSYALLSLLALIHLRQMIPFVVLL